MFTSAISSSRTGLRENESLFHCCFCSTISNFNPSLVHCGILPPRTDPQGRESAGQLQTWCDMEQVGHPSGEQSQSPWKKEK